MGQLVLPLFGTIYVDTNAVIYRVERVEPIYSAALPLWVALDECQRQLCTSELTLLESLVKPFRERKPELADLFRELLLGTIGMTCLPIDRAILETAARLRADHRLKTPDSIHAATALESGCSLFVTNDPEFRKVPGLDVAVLSDLVSM